MGFLLIALCIIMSCGALDCYDRVRMDFPNLPEHLPPTSRAKYCQPFPPSTKRKKRHQRDGHVRKVHAVQGNSSFVNVIDFGAKGDGVSDNAVAFQKAIDSLSGGGGVVWCPSGKYLFLSPINLNSGVTLKGTFTIVPSHQGGSPSNDGSWLLPKFGRNNPTGNAFIKVESDSTLSGFTIWYPGTIELTGNNAAVTDVELLNSWNGISAVGAARHYLLRIEGQPTNQGIFIDQTYGKSVFFVHIGKSCPHRFRYWKS